MLSLTLLGSAVGEVGPGPGFSGSGYGSSHAPPAASLGFKRGMWPIKPMPPTLPCLETKERMKAQQEVVTLLRALKCLSPNNVFIFHDDETGKSLNFLLPMQHRKGRNEILERQAAIFPPNQVFSSKKTKGSVEDFMEVSLHSARYFSPSCPQAIILSPS